MVHIWSIAFDGMHRCGKWSQIKLLKDYLHNQYIDNIIVRWEYYRTGNGINKLEDPKSQRWKENIYNTNYEEKSNRLNRELFILHKRKYPEYLRNNKINKWIIIQDRSIIGNYLFKSGENKDIDNIEYFNYGKWNIFINKVIIPDLIFLLQPSKEALLERLHKWFDINEDNAEWRLQYKIKYISEKYDTYYDGYKNIPPHIKNKIIHILWDFEKDEIHSIVQKKISGLYEWTIF